MAARAAKSQLRTDPSRLLSVSLSEPPMTRMILASLRAPPQAINSVPENSAAARRSAVGARAPPNRTFLFALRAKLCIQTSVPGPPVATGNRRRAYVAGVLGSQHVGRAPAA